MGLREEIPESAVVTFGKGIPGLDAREFVILKPDGLEPIVLLQSVDQPEVGLPAIPCMAVLPDYHVNLDARDRGELGIAEGAVDPALLYLAVLIMDTTETGPCCNLAAPIVINPENNRGCQISQLESRYATLHPLAEA